MLKIGAPLQMTDQGLTNTDPRYIATSSTINNIVTDVRGLSPSRTPEQVSRSHITQTLPVTLCSKTLLLPVTL